MHDHLDLVGPRAPNSSRASMTSSALLNIVALSIEIRSPMSQFGCARACCRRRRRHPAGGPVAERPARGGQDHPLDLAGALAAQRLEDGAVLAVDRDQPGAVRGAGAAASARRRRPCSPCWRAPAPRRAAPARAPAPAPPRRRSPTSPSRPARPPRRRAPPARPPRAMPLPSSAASSSASRAGSAVTATRGPQPPRLLGEQRDVAAAGQRHHLVGLGPALRLEQRDGVAARPSRSRRRC